MDHDRQSGIAVREFFNGKDLQPVRHRAVNERNEAIRLDFGTGRIIQPDIHQLSLCPPSKRKRPGVCNFWIRMKSLGISKRKFCPQECTYPNLLHIQMTCVTHCAVFFKCKPDPFHLLSFPRQRTEPAYCCFLRLNIMESLNDPTAIASCAAIRTKYSIQTVFIFFP